jgi:hypothetical protein
LQCTPAAANNATANLSDSMLQILLNNAVVEGNIKGVRMCVKLGADIHARNPDSTPPVLIAVHTGCDQSTG